MYAHIHTVILFCRLVSATFVLAIDIIIVIVCVWVDKIIQSNWIPGTSTLSVNRIKFMSVKDAYLNMFFVRFTKLVTC